jgi:hypothetical protein
MTLTQLDSTCEQEAPCAPRRVLAFLIYFNSVHRGGETVFLQQGKRVEPKCGRVLMFPTAFTCARPSPKSILMSNLPTQKCFALVCSTGAAMA